MKSEFHSYYSGIHGLSSSQWHDDVRGISSVSSVYEHIDQMMLGVNSEGALCAQSQVEDYICRGDALEQYNLLDYFVDTYEDDLKKRTESKQILLTTVGTFEDDLPGHVSLIKHLILVINGRFTCCAVSQPPDTAQCRQLLVSQTQSPHASI